MFKGKNNDGANQQQQPENEAIPQISQRSGLDMNEETELKYFSALPDKNERSSPAFGELPIIGGMLDRQRGVEIEAGTGGEVSKPDENDSQSCANQ
jgi:hypothetical protein